MTQPLCLPTPPARRIRMISILLICLILGGCHMLPTSFAQFPQIAPDTFSSGPLFLAMDKQEFAAQVTEQYWSQDPDASLLQDTETIDELILQAVRLITPERKAIHEQLTAYGIYAMPMGFDTISDLDQTEATILPAKNYSDSVYLEPPTIYYQVPTNQWIVAFSGSWISDDWKHGKGWGHEVGGLESFGINIEDNGNDPGMICNRVCGALYDTGKYNLMQSSAVYDANGKPGSVSTGNRSNGSTADGFGFQLQDRVESEFPFLKSTYLGYEWAGLCVYSGEFAQLDATLTAYYIHTYGEKTNGYELPLGQENALDGVPVNGLTGEPIDTTDGYFVRYSQGVVLSPAP